MARQHHRIALALSVALLSAAPAAAQESGDDEAQARFEEGVEHLREQRFEEAARAFRQAYRAAPRVETMCNLALTYDRWGGHADRAVRAYRTCARDDESGRYRGFAEQRSAELERELALSEGMEPEAEETAAEETAAEAREAPATEPPVVAPPPTEPDHGLAIAGATVGGVGLVGLGAAIALALESGAITDELLTQLGPSPTVVRDSDEHRRLEDAQTFAVSATALYVASGVLLAAAATLIVIDLVSAGSADEASVAITPSPTGATLRGRF